MSTPYYADDLVTLHHGDCRDLLLALERGSVDVLLTDPPYFQVKDEDWDRQWREADEFLAWLGGVLDLCKPLLKPSASVWVFASPFMVRRVEDLVGDRFRVLNSIRWVKESGHHKKMEIQTQRRYLTPWEGIVFAEQYHELWGEQDDALHREVFAPIGQYIVGERERAGLSRKEFATRLPGYKNVDSASANVWNWELGKNRIGAADYAAARAALGAGFLTRGHDDLCREWVALTATYEARRRPFQLARTGPVTDLWTFPKLEAYPGKHPCEKPASMIRHMLSTSTHPGATVLDPFAGSASTLRVCKELGLRGIGMETNTTYCQRAVHRLSQEVLALELAGG